MVYSFVIGGYPVTVAVKASEALSMGPVYAFTVQATARDGRAVVQELYTPKYDHPGGVEGLAKRRARFVIRHAMVQHERNVNFSHHDHLINTRGFNMVRLIPEWYRHHLMEAIKAGSMKGSMKMILAAGEEWLS